MQQGLDAVFAADAALFIAAYGHLCGRFAPAVDPADAGFDLADDAVGAFQIGRYHAGSQAVGGGVGAHNHFFFGGVAQNAHHRAEDFFAHDGHVVEAVGKHGGGNVSAFVKRVCIEALPARKQARTFGAAFFDIGEHFFHMGKARQGAEIGVRIKRVANADARHAL